MPLPPPGSSTAPSLSCGQNRVVEYGQQQVGGQAVGHLAAAAVVQKDLVRFFNLIISCLNTDCYKATCQDRSPDQPSRDSGNRPRRCLRWRPCRAPPDARGADRLVTGGTRAGFSCRSEPPRRRIPLVPALGYSRCRIAFAASWAANASRMRKPLPGMSPIPRQIGIRRLENLVPSAAAPWGCLRR